MKVERGERRQRWQRCGELAEEWSEIERKIRWKEKTDVERERG